MRSRGSRVKVALVAVAATCALAASTALGAAGEIAYRCNNNDICLLDPDAPSPVVNLTFNDSSSGEAYPFWSPDGSRVGFTSSYPNTAGGGNPENLFTMDPSATGNAFNVATQLTTYTSGVTREAQWSPDGSKVAYAHGPGSYPGIFVVNADGSSATPTTIATEGNGPTSSDSGPSFSPDGTKIAYAHGEQIYIANADGSGTPQPLAGATGHSPVWSPDGARIAYDVNKSLSFVDLHIVRVDGTGTPVVIPLTNSEWSYARWSPDGTQIAFRSVAGSGDGFFSVANADGSGSHPLATNPSQNDNNAPSWSPDGSRLTFSAYNYSSGTGITEVHIVNADGTGSDQTLTTGGGNADAIWRPAKKVVVPPEQPPLPGPVKPKLVWITKRIPVQPNAPFHVMIVSCPTIQCKLDYEAGAKKGGSKRVATRFEKKSQVLAKGSATVAEGESKEAKAKLTHLGRKLLSKRGSLKLSFKVTTHIEGQPDSVAKHDVRIYLK